MFRSDRSTPGTRAKRATRREPPVRGRGLICALLLAVGTCWLLAGQPAAAKVEPEASRAHYEAAAAYAGRGELRAAVIELKNALQRDPQNAEARLLLGDVYARMGDGAAAEKELRAAERLGIERPRLVVPLGRALAQQGRFEQLLEELPAEGHGPALDLEVLLLRAEAQAGLGQWDAARASYDTAAGKAPGDARIPFGRGRIALAQGDLAVAEAEATAALAQDAGMPEALLLQAEARRLRGDPEGAIVPFEAILAKPGVSPGIAVRARLGLAGALLALNRDAEAQREISGVLDIAPQLPLAAYLQALIQVRGQDYAAARKALEAAAPALEGFPPAQFLFGAVYYQAEELETARSWLARHLRAVPQNLQARKLLAATLLRLKAVDEALKVLEPAVQQAPDDPQVLLLLGNAYLGSGRMAEASAMLGRAAELAPQDPRVLSQLAVTQLATGERDEALATLNATFDLGADASAIGYALAFSHLQAGAFEDALKVAQDLSRRFPQSAIAANLEGGAYAALGDLDKARTSFERGLAIEPDFNEARANLAALKARSGDTAGAEAEYQEILSREADNPAALLGMAELANHRGDASATRQWLESAVKANPDNLKASLALGEHLTQQGDLAGAIQLLQDFTTRQPRNPQALLALGRAQSRAGAFPEAVRSYRRLSEVTDGSAGSRLLLAEAQLAAGELDAATASYEGLKEVAADNPVVWNNLAWLYQQAGDARAVAHGEKALELAPSQPAIMDTLGWILLDTGQVERALDLLKQAHEAAPAADDIAYHYAAALHRTGDNAAARALLEATLQSGRPFAARAEAAALLEKLGS